MKSLLSIPHSRSDHTSMCTLFVQFLICQGQQISRKVLGLCRARVLDDWRSPWPLSLSSSDWWHCFFVLFFGHLAWVTECSVTTCCDWVTLCRSLENSPFINAICFQTAAHVWLFFKSVRKSRGFRHRFVLFSFFFFFSVWLVICFSLQ